MDLLESKKEDYLFKIKQIELLKKRLGFYFGGGLPHYHLPAINPGYIATEDGDVLPIIIYGGNKAMTLCPHCERLHDYHTQPVSNTPLDCPYMMNGSRFVALQYGDLDKVNLEPGSRFDPKKHRENPKLDTKPIPETFSPISIKSLIK